METKKYNMDLIYELIKDTSMSASELQVECKLSKSTITKYLRELRDNNKVYICEYKYSSGIGIKNVPVYKAGESEDIKCIPSKMKGWDKNKRSYPKKWVPEESGPIVPFRDFFTKAFFGEYKKVNK